MAELVRSKGYAAEEHVTTTEDGYVLSLQHVLSGGGRLPGALPGPPVLLVHGLLSSAVEWVINYPHQSLGFLLADAGYDVWLGNYRGTPYSRGHREYSDSDSRYWDFRLDEIGLLDLPALVDYVLAITGWPQLFLVGFSQGNTAAWAMLADKPQYNNKILVVVALAPVANMTFIRSPVRVLVPISPLLTASAIAANRGRLLVRPQWLRRVAYALCESPLRYACALPTFILFGVNPNQVNQVDSPAYDFSKITAPVALFSARNDFFANPEDVSTLRRSLPNVVMDYIVPEPAFTHLDFVLGTDAATVVYRPLIDFMNYWMLLYGA
ncbi:hypothetical protein HPB52_014763 [Rhipicephalus sanguineus]|uniref:Partial AB-hydrolase lipase domain-containing protein n=1 Tax=Rhipicephalus sanguineus TaxID=34632 RepID=A0A9D4SPU9_RHISA|nr:hypothetical protein HPB52_014763 [Rhipicephalus sanguineus]